MWPEGCSWLASRSRSARDGYPRAENRTIQEEDMKAAREIMTPGAAWIDCNATVAQASETMAENDFGAMPMCDGDGHLQG